MARSSSTNITSMPQSVEEEQRARIRKYLLLMGIRVVCFLALIWVRGPWMLVFGAGAIFLPYFAVVIANAIQARRTDSVERPGGIEPLYPPATWFDQRGPGESGDEERR